MKESGKRFYYRRANQRARKEQSNRGRRRADFGFRAPLSTAAVCSTGSWQRLGSDVWMPVSPSSSPETRPRLGCAARQPALNVAAALDMPLPLPPPPPPPPPLLLHRCGCRGSRPIRLARAALPTLARSGGSSACFAARRFPSRGSGAGAGPAS